MRQGSPGNTLTITAPTGGFKEGVATMLGELFVVPTKAAKENQHVTVYIKGNFEDFQDQLADGVTPNYAGEAAYWKDGKLTNLKTGAVKVGYFVTAHDAPTLHLTGA